MIDWGNLAFKQVLGLLGLVLGLLLTYYVGLLEVAVCVMILLFSRIFFSNLFDHRYFWKFFLFYALYRSSVFLSVNQIYFDLFFMNLFVVLNKLKIISNVIFHIYFFFLLSTQQFIFSILLRNQVINSMDRRIFIFNFHNNFLRDVVLSVVKIVLVFIGQLFRFFRTLDNVVIIFIVVLIISYVIVDSLKTFCNFRNWTLWCFDFFLLFLLLYGLSQLKSCWFIYPDILIGKSFRYFRVVSIFLSVTLFAISLGILRTVFLNVFIIVFSLLFSPSFKLFLFLKHFLFDFNDAIPMLVYSLVDFFNDMITNLMLNVFSLLVESFIVFRLLFFHNMIHIPINKVKLSLFEIIPQVHSIVYDSPNCPQDHNHVENTQSNNQGLCHWCLLIREHYTVIHVVVHQVAFQQYQSTYHQRLNDCIYHINVRSKVQYVENVNEVCDNE